MEIRCEFLRRDGRGVRAMAITRRIRQRGNFVIRSGEAIGEVHHRPSEMGGISHMDTGISREMRRVRRRAPGVRPRQDT